MCRALDSTAMTASSTSACGSRGAAGPCHFLRTARTLLVALVTSTVAASTFYATPAAAEPPLSAEFARESDKRLIVPLDERLEYAKRLAAALDAAGRGEMQAQFAVLVDRSRYVQAIFVFWRSAEGAWEFVGASPVATGRPGEFDHFYTPLGVFAHTLDNMDFRAEGTKNTLGIRGYGTRGMRVYDFGWATAERGWGAGGAGVMRLQMHATDPERLEPLLGTWHSKGCIRIPASLNRFIDRYGLIDADYEHAAAQGRKLWILLPERTPTAWPGRYLVVVDSLRSSQPAWAQWRSKNRATIGIAASHEGSEVC